MHTCWNMLVTFIVLHIHCQRKEKKMHSEFQTLKKAKKTREMLEFLATVAQKLSLQKSVNVVHRLIDDERQNCIHSIWDCEKGKKLLVYAMCHVPMCHSIHLDACKNALAQNDFATIKYVHYPFNWEFNISNQKTSFEISIAVALAHMPHSHHPVYATSINENCKILQISYIVPQRTITTFSWRWVSQDYGWSHRSIVNIQHFTLWNVAIPIGQLFPLWYWTNHTNSLIPFRNLTQHSNKAQ